jgi:hypothetical protein
LDRIFSLQYFPEMAYPLLLFFFSLCKGACFGIIRVYYYQFTGILERYCRKYVFLL